MSYKKNIAEVDDETRGLSNDEDNIPTENRVNEEEQTAKQAEIPEIDGNYAAALFFRDNPLPEEAHEKKGLSDKTNCQQPEL
ncbi:hypothetical protein JCM14713_20840 [Desulfomicrobium salsuginis]